MIPFKKSNAFVLHTLCKIFFKVFFFFMNRETAIDVQKAG